MAASAAQEGALLDAKIFVEGRGNEVGAVARVGAFVQHALRRRIRSVLFLSTGHFPFGQIER
jgi:hypothetical protein